MSVIKLIAILCLCVLKVGSRNIYQTHQHIERAGYVAETHHAITQDGYILEMHRIPFKRHETSGSPDRPVVLILHGLMGSSNNFIILGINNAIAYNLADAGFDVWLGNARGTRNSRRHITLDPDANSTEFFDFTWNEMGMYDLPAMIDYILENTRSERLHYLGHSQGGTAFLVMGSTRPEYNEKIATAHLLAGVGYKTHFPNSILRGIAAYTNILWPLAQSIGLVELIPPNILLPLSEGTELDIQKYCTGNSEEQEICIMTAIQELMKITSHHTFESEYFTIPGFGGGAFKQVAHYGQNINDDRFRQWDFGLLGNIAQYGSSEPPVYNLSLITAEVTMHYTVNDALLDERDVLAMARDMPRTKARRIARDSFLHADFIIARDVRELVTVYIIDSISNYNSTPEVIPPEPEIIDPGLPDSSSTIVLSLFVKIYLTIFTLYCFSML